MGNGVWRSMNPSPGPANEQKTILVVDDDPEILTLIFHLLSDTYDVLLANSGPEGFDCAVQHPGSIHVLVTDFQMPGMSGLDLAAKITDERPQVAILIMSGIAVDAVTLNDGWHFLAKPFLPSQLLDLIARIGPPKTPASRAAYTGSH